MSVDKVKEKKTFIKKVVDELRTKQEGEEATAEPMDTDIAGALCFFFLSW